MVKNPLNQKVLREIKSNWKQYLSVIMIAVLAVTLFTGILANWRNFQLKLDTIYDRGSMADGIVMVEKADAKLEKYLDDNDVSYQKRIFLPAKSAQIDVNIIIFNDNDKYNRPAYMSTDLLTSDMVLVDDNFIARKEIAIGDSFEVNIPSLNIMGLDLKNIELDFNISGTMTHPEALDDSNYTSALLYIGDEALIKAIREYVLSDYPAFASIVTEDLIRDKIPELQNQYVIKSADIEDHLDYINENFNVLYGLETKNLPSNLTIEADVIQAKQLIYIFPIIFYLVAVLIILTSISQLINKEQKNIGLLKALGYSNFEILMHYTNIFLGLCLIGSILGMILGPLIIPSVMDQKYNILYQLPKIHTPFFRAEYLYSVLILFVVTFLNSIFACRSSLKKVPAEAIRGENSYKMKPTLFDRLPVLENKWLPFRMALRNMKRKISRTLMVLLGTMGCSALLVCGFGIEDTLDNSINKELSLIPYDVNLSYKDFTSKKEALNQIENVSFVDEYAKYEIDISFNKLISSYIYLLPEESHVFVPSYDKNSCLISTKVAKEIGANPGDVISFNYANKKYEIEVTKIIDVSFSQGIFITQSANIIDYKPTNAWIKSTSYSENDSIKASSMEIEGVLSAVSMQETLAMIDNTLESIRIMTNTVKIFAILLALVVLYNLALLNFKERTKDIATLKVLGFNKREIAASFLIEILLLTLLGSLVGLALGYPLMYSVLSINENPLLSYLYHIDGSSYLWTVLITAGSSLIINLLISRFTDRVEMVESLKAIE